MPPTTGWSTARTWKRPPASTPWHESGPGARGQAALADKTPLRGRTDSAAARPKEPRFDVVGFGALNLDHLYQVPQLIQDGGVEVLASTAQPGGSAANTIYRPAK